jgi:hypothetical protein
MFYEKRVKIRCTYLSDRLVFEPAVFGQKIAFCSANGAI